MRESHVEQTPTPKYRSDYEAPAFWIEKTELDFQLGEEGSVVRARLEMARNLLLDDRARPLVLDGTQLELLSLKVDGMQLPEQSYIVEEETLTIAELPDEFTLETEVRIHPEANTSLMGLYKSSGNFCTQCEAEGFRKITYYLDRPDVMSKFRVTITADKERYPILLSNGNRLSAEDLSDGRHRATWEDPFKKPSYLFALVAGDLVAHRDSFRTCSGREIPLEIWVQEQDLDKCEHAMRSLQQAMRWDEERFGLEYDLDIFMIVAVSDFNMGAMENKGLNIFNTSCVLAKAETATDANYEAVQGVIAHEYFHNWTGNRVTCRDWFQLTLKEGLTVFRDQEFTADHNSRLVERIDTVRALRVAQFAEDAGPMSHPIRPESYIEMNNFYTATVYSKGAEVIRMYQTLLGVQGFRKGMDLYFERHDGQAVTCDDFRAAMADANGRDLSQFERWYDQRGTPTVKIRSEWDAASGTYALHFVQEPVRAKDQKDPKPYHIPVSMGLLGKDGEELPLVLEGESDREAGTRTIEVTEMEQSFRFTGLDSEPTPSLFRGFSAPVKVEYERSEDELAFLMSHDTDGFQRWEAGQEYATRVLLSQVGAIRAGKSEDIDTKFIEAFGRVLEDESIDGSYKALALTLPVERVLAQAMQVIDPDAIHHARSKMIEELTKAHEASFARIYEETRPQGPFKITDVDRRRINGLCLRYLASSNSEEVASLCLKHYQAADNMTDTMAAMNALLDFDCPERAQLFQDFEKKWKHEALVMDKWFMAQASSSLPGTLDRIRELARHEDFQIENPNRVRSLFAAFAMGNQFVFHHASGEGYAFLGEFIGRLDAINPSISARLAGAFNPWRRFDEARQVLMRKELELLAANESLSRDCREIVSRALQN